MPDSKPKPRRLPRGTLPALATAAIALLIPIAGEHLLPVYDRGVAQSPLAYLQGLAFVLIVPGKAVNKLYGLYAGHSLQPLVVQSLLFLTYFLLTFVAVRCFAVARRKPAPPAVTADDQPASPSRRRFLAASTSSLYAAGVTFGSYSLFLEPRAVRVRHYAIPITDLPPSLEGITLAQVTDIHHCRWLPIPYVDRVVRTTNALSPDLILLTGDYSLHSPRYVPPVVNSLANLRAKIGTVAVLGNHDWNAGTGPLTQQLLRAAGFPLLDNTRVLLTPDRRLVPIAPSRRSERSEESKAPDPQGLVLAGVGDLWRDRQDYHAALGNLPPAMPRLLLSHNPDVASTPEFIGCGHRCDLIISGHTHGGQIRIPFLGSPWIPSDFGDKYARGLNASPTTRVFTCPGIGMTSLPLRFASPPEISVLHLHRA